MAALDVCCQVRAHSGRADGAGWSPKTGREGVLRRASYPPQNSSYSKPKQRRSGRAALSGGPPDLRLTRGLTGRTGPEHEASYSEGSQSREQANRDAPGEPKDDETGQGCGSTDESIWDLCRDVIDEMYARPDGRQDRGVGQRGCVVPEDGTREYRAEHGDQQREILAARSVVSSGP